MMTAMRSTTTKADSNDVRLSGPLGTAVEAISVERISRLTVGLPGRLVPPSLRFPEP